MKITQAERRAAAKKEITRILKEEKYREIGDLLYDYLPTGPKSMRELQRFLAPLGYGWVLLRRVLATNCSGREFEYRYNMELGRCGWRNKVVQK